MPPSGGHARSASLWSVGRFFNGDEPNASSQNDKQDSLTSFPQDGFDNPINGEPTFLNSISNRVFSAASSVMSNVRPTASMDRASDMSSTIPVEVPNQPNIRFPNGKLSPSIGTSSKLPLLTPSVRPINTSVSPVDPPADVWTDNVPFAEELDIQTPLSASPIHRNGLSRQASFSTLYSVNPLSHLPGYTGDRDDNSDTESIMSKPASSFITREDINSGSHIGPGALSKEFWMKDRSVVECFACGRPFSTFRRKHHCRICGQIFCSTCTVLIDGQQFNYDGKMRVCRNCLELLDQYQADQNNDDIHGVPLNSPMRLNQSDKNDSRRNIEISYNNSPITGPRMAIPATKQGGSLEISPSSDNTRLQRSSSRHRNERNRPRSSTIDARPRSRNQLSRLSMISIQDSNEEITLTDNETDSLEDEQALRAYSFLRDDETSGSNVRSSGDVHTPPSSPHVTRRSNRPYESRQGLSHIISRRKSLPSTALGRPTWLTEEPNINFSPSGRQLFKPVHAYQRESATTSSPSVDLNNASIAHIHLFISQLLKEYNLDESWHKSLVKPLLQCSENINLDIKGGNSIDVRHYVKLKRIPGGRRTDTRYIDGIVFSHSLALKTMRQKIIQPKILLITFPIEYNRGDNHFMSLEPIIAQEFEYLKKLVWRLVSLRPNIVLAGGSVSGVALRLLADCDITLFTNVKPEVIERVARYTKADILSSMDKLAVNPQLGTCDLYELKSFKYDNHYKNCVFLSGIGKDVGCTIIIRGGDNEELQKIKAITDFMTYVVFNLKLETSLMRDQFVLIPTEDESLKCGPPPVTDDTVSSKYFDDIVKLQSSQAVSSSPFVHYGTPFLLKHAREAEEKYNTVKRENDQLNTENEEGVQKALKVLGLDEIEFNDLPNSAELVKEFIHIVMDKRLERLNHECLAQKKFWEQVFSRNPYMFSPMNHQSIVFLYSQVNSKTRAPCVGPDQVGIEFYGDTDLTIGQYVEQLCITASEPCPECNNSLGDHYRSYVNGTGRITAAVEKFECRLPGLENTILMWSYCKICEQTMPVVPMSSAAWHYSFGKYIELSIWSNPLSLRAGMCPHNLYRDHVRFFGFQNLAVRIEYDDITLLDIQPPQPKVFWKPQDIITLKVLNYRDVKNKVIRYYESVVDRLNKASESMYQHEKLDEFREKISNLKEKADKERQELLDELSESFLNTVFTEGLKLNAILRDMQSQVISWDAEFAELENTFLMSDSDLARVMSQQLKRIFLTDESNAEASAPSTGTVEKDDPFRDISDGEVVGEKETRSEKEGEEKKTEAKDKDVEECEIVRSETVKGKTVKNGEKPTEEQKQVQIDKSETSVDKLVEDATHKRVEKEKHVQKSKETGKQTDTPTMRSPLDNPTEGNHVEYLDLEPSVDDRQKNLVISPVKEKVELFEEHARAQSKEISDDIALSSNKRDEETCNRRLEFDKSKPKHLTNSKMAASAASAAFNRKNDVPSSNSNLRKKFTERLGLHPQLFSRNFADVREFERRILQGRGAALSKSRVATLAKHFDDLSEEIKKERQQERRRLFEDRYRAYPVTSAKPTVEVYRNFEDAMGHASDEEDEETSNRPSSTFTSETSLSAQDTTISESQITVSSEEPKEDKNDELSKETTTSKPDINSTQTDKDHTTMQSLMQSLSTFWNDKSSRGWKPLAYPITASEHIFADSDIVSRDDEPSSLISLCLSTPDYIERMNAQSEEDQSSTKQERSDLEERMLRTTATHLKYQFDQGGRKQSCRIFYAEQFEAFRKQCGCDVNYIPSLSRCVTWDSTGGKSGSAFLKTLDDRLVVKELSPNELDAFVEFAPSYFEYMAQAFFHDLPTVLAKIFGFYQIMIRNPVTGKTVRANFVVMENLFYNRKPSRIFDLKGSMRNRHVQQTGKENEVLLDENMVEYIYESPLFLREHSKRQLRSSLFNDTLFLAKMNVMDYSLVVGLDKEKDELVVGIIDFIRTFTWDKKLESWVKERGLVRGGVKEPTVVSPRQYKNRFREAMERYVLMVPDCWFQGKTLY